jgi:hypothetical protein
MNLNGWKRLGTIASVIWVLDAGAYTYTKELDENSKLIANSHVACDENLAGKTGKEWTKGLDACNKEANDSLASLYPGARLDAAIVAFVPVPLFWGFAYLILFLWRWVKRGFKERSEFTMFE